VCVCVLFRLRFELRSYLRSELVIASQLISGEEEDRMNSKVHNRLVKSGGPGAHNLLEPRAQSKYKVH